MAALGIAWAFIKGVSPKTWALIGAALFVLGLLAYGRHWHGEAVKARAQVSADCGAARISAANPRMACDQTDEQIKYLGQTITALSHALDRQNAAVAAMGEETKRQAADLADAKKQADKRAEKPQATSARLAESARAPERQSKPCDPSKELQNVWR